MRRKTHREFLEEVNEKKGEEYTVLSEYVTSKTKIRIKHNKCGREFETTPSTFLSTKSGCITCGYGDMKRLQRKTDAEFKEEVTSLVGDEYRFIDIYINNTTKLRVTHLRCGHSYKVTPRDFLSGRRCPNCKNKRISAGVTLTQEEFEDRLKRRYQNEFTIDGNYENARTPITIKHQKCGAIYKVMPSKFLYESRCPRCSNVQNSFGEYKVMEYLESNNFDYLRQYCFTDCSHIRPLPFDFAIVKDSKVVSLIEYQGRQHYEPVEFFGGEEEFELRKKRDKIKRDFCAENEIPLIEIPYYEDVSTFLDSKLKSII